MNADNTMNIFTYKFIIHLVLVVTASSLKEEIDPIDDENDKFEETERRSVLEVTDKDWYAAHLDVDTLSRRAGCEEETLDDRIKRYRKSIKEDAGRIEFVSADSLPVSDKDLHVEQCVPDSADKNSTRDISDTKTKDDANNPIVGTEATEQTATLEDSEKPLSSMERTGGITPISNVKLNGATVLSVTESMDEGKATKNKGEKDGADVRRSNDYQFSSVEYADESIEFDESKCPGIVDVITLEQDIIRKYDVECELTLEWKSLE